MKLEKPAKLKYTREESCVSRRGWFIRAGYGNQLVELGGSSLLIATPEFSIDVARNFVVSWCFEVFCF